MKLPRPTAYKLNSLLNQTDATVDRFLYPAVIRKLSSVHWTPLEIARRASHWLAPKPGIRVLDIGSGVGKFCLIGACHTKGHFTGVEYRENLVRQANKAMEKARVKNVAFIHADMLSVDFSLFDSFYFFNPFFENVARSIAIDDQVVLSRNLYEQYISHVRRELDRSKSGTRVATYCSSDSFIPKSYVMDTKRSEENGLKFWMKP